jgi:predicted MFS family arabinose efflux permease
LYWYGVIFALMQISSALSARHAHVLAKRGETKSVFMLYSAIGIVFMVFAASESLFILPLIVVHALIWGVSTPLILDRMNALTSSDVRATTLSVGSMIGRIITITGGPLFGLATDRYSLQTAYGAMGILYLAAIAILAGGLLCKKGRRNIKPA